MLVHRNSDLSLSLSFLFFSLQQMIEMDAYFPCSAVIYSSHEIVLGAGAVSDCRLAGCATDKYRSAAHSWLGAVVICRWQTKQEH